MSDLPEGWAEVALGDICSVAAGGTPPRSRPELFGGGIPWVKIGDLAQGLVVSTEETISSDGLASSSAKVFPAGTLLLSIFATIGRTAVLGIDAATNQAVAGITPDKGSADPRFLRRFLESAAAPLASQSRGAAQANINLGILRSLPIPLPPLEEQRRIAAILDKADELRAKRRATLEHLDSLTQAIFYDMFGDPVMPGGQWERQPLGVIAQTMSGGTPDRSRSDYYNGRIPWVKSGELHAGVVVTTEESLSDAGIANSAAKVMEPGTILVAMYGATAGLVAQLGVRAATNQAICSIAPGESVHVVYLVHTLRRLSAVLVGRTVGGAQPNLSQRTIRELEIPVPPVDLQCAFARRYDAVRILEDQQRSCLQRSEALFSSLQSRAFRGEL